ncbi:MAG: glycerate kinase, partial [Candidatus Dormibacteraeota bacterium]|nr:glycerate kinase [Candidatus Dormibacteraeota bacterium]MBO0761020.1 glycerate kinase [Candidatus Dormibacteraeota bacterium]
ARLRRGAPLVVEAAGLDRALPGAAAVVTGEGRVDGQSIFGKGPIEVAHRAAASGVPVALVTGGLGPDWELVLHEGVAVVEPLAEGLPLAERLARTPELLRAAAARAVVRLEELSRSTGRDRGRSC